MEQTPLLITLFGASGDLAKRKLYPAIFNLYKNGLLSDRFALIGTARREWDHQYFRNIVLTSIAHLITDPEQAQQFVSHFYYQSHDVTKYDDYALLAEFADSLDARYQLDGNRLFYLSTAPNFFSVIAENIKSKHLLGTGFNRLIIEKPFGHDEQSAVELQAQLNVAFEESQIFRIDHYLGKELTQAIYNLRFDNILFEKVWNNQYIDNIQITLAEELGVEERGGYYDKSGATRDMVQNHILQLFTLMAMAKPETNRSHAIRAEKLRVLEALNHYHSQEELAHNVVRAQYGSHAEKNIKGYLEEDNVSPTSKTETYFAAALSLNLPEWDGVPFYVRTGKRLDRKATLIDVMFKPVNGQKTGDHLQIEIAPNIGYTLWINSKQVGYGLESEPIALQYHYSSEVLKGSPEDYERLIGECIEGHRKHFAQWCEVEYAWKFIDMIHRFWDALPDTPLLQYEPNTTGPKEADALLERNGHYWAV